MKYIKTPKLVINNVDYTDRLRGKTLVPGGVIITLPEKTLPATPISVSLKSPIQTTGTLDTQMYNNIILFGTKYNSSYTKLLENIKSSSSTKWDISKGKLYFENTLVDSDTDWKKLCFCTDYLNVDWAENYVTYAIKAGNLYKVYTETVRTPQEPIITITPLYAWTYNSTTVFTMSENPTENTSVYDWDGTDLTSNGYVFSVDLEDDEVTAIYLTDGGDKYERDSAKDDQRETHTSRPDIITHEPRTELVSSTYTFTDITGMVSSPYNNSNYQCAYTLTADGKLYSIKRNGTLTKLLDDVNQISVLPPKQDTLLAECSGTIYKIVYYPGGSSTTPTVTELYTLPKKKSIILPTGYNPEYPLPAKLIICDGNLYAGSNCISNTGSWTQVSVGYECGYGIDNGNLYRIYGTNSQWYNQTPKSSDITLVDNTKIWSYVICQYSTAYAFTSTGEMYYVRNLNLSKQRTVSLGDWESDYEEYSYTLDSGNESSSQQITLPLQLINTLIEES